MATKLCSGLKFFVIVLVNEFLCVSSLDIRLPPAITKAPSVEPKIFRSDDEITLDCVASGFPNPEYEWFKNNRLLTIPSALGNIRQISDGTIQITASSFDEGSYQCAASNQYGKTFSPPAVLQRAVLDLVGSSQVEETEPMEPGQPYVIRCQQRKCFPKPTFSWAVSESTVAVEKVPVSLDRRVQIDENGDLHFSYLLPTDARNGMLYKCLVFNPYIDLTMGGGYTKLNVRPGNEIQPFSPKLLFYTESKYIALEGKNASMRCFFAGYPDPTITWSAKNGALPRGRFASLHFNTELHISNLQQSDEGVYVCKGSNTESRSAEEHKINLEVQAPPTFLSNNDRPHDMNVTDGSSVEIVCNAYADPAASVTWFIDGEKINRDKLPPRFRLSSNGVTLYISNVCRDCPDGTSDIRVIQCNASNPHGVAFASGYINVLKKTLLEIKPADVSVASDDTHASFNCSGSSDDITPVSIKWFKLHNEDIGFVPVNEIPGKIVLEKNGTLVFQLPDNSSSWSSHGGRYKCVISNSYSEDSAEARLHVKSDETSPIILPVQAGFDWWIILLVLLLILIILLIICCCCYLLRSRGETYFVDEKERKNGHIPEKELADSGFHDYIRPENMKAGSRPSLGSTHKSNSDDEMSLNEYGDIDAGKFTEDGSFIGDYGDRAYV